jgi:Mn-containing catalase
MITLDKWYPYIIERQGVQTVAFNAAVKKVQEEYALAVEANKKERVSNDFVVDLYNKNARQNTIELEMFENRRRFQIFV